jgi:hypothetical protein
MKGYLILLVVLLSACAAKKQAVEFEAQPSWMKQKPIIPGYYIGIGSSSKVGTSAEYIANARKDALADLAGEVSSQVSSTSVYHTIENKYGHIESFDQRIETSVDDYLEGFEPVEYYENESLYWVYFRISKETYVEKKELKKQEALYVAMAKYNSGLQEEKAWRPKEALSFYLQGLQAIKPYLKEETSVSMNETKVDIGNLLFSSMDQSLASLNITSEIKEITIKRGTAFGEALKFRVLFKNNPAQGIPVGFTYTGGYLKNDRQTTDKDGFVYLQPEMVYSRNRQEQMTAEINLKDIASKAVEDTFIRGLILKKSLSPALLNITIESPVLLLKIAENCCNDDECLRLNKVFSQIAVNGGYQFAESAPSDYSFYVSYGFNAGTSAGGLMPVDLKGGLKLTDKNNNTIWTKEITGIRGVGANIAEARVRAFNEFITSLDHNYIRQGLDKIMPGY